ncbi:DoxX family protein [Actinomadura sp. 3N407]|uniref:DoxX family protein n=1 Tax=Actinomadura sp. 3N407 TaxID=3457423 RepID=UPI003FCD716A
MTRGRSARGRDRRWLSPALTRQRKNLEEKSAVETFTEIGWGQWFRYATGAVEAAGAIALVIPRLAGLAAAGLIGLMGGAVLTQILVLEPAWALLPAAYAAVFAAVAWDRRAESRRVLRSLRGRAGR